MTATPPCPCGQPATQGFLCRACARQLVADVRSAPGWYDQLQLVTARLTRYTDPAGRSNGAAPLPFNEAAHEPTRRLVRALHAMGRTTGLRVHARHSPGFVAAWINGHMAELRRHPDVVQLRGALRSALAEAVAVCDRPPDSWYAGRCECGTDLYPRELDDRVTCHKCERSYDTRARRSELMALVRDQLAPGPEIIRALTSLGNPVTVDRIKKWRAAGRLKVRNTTGGPGTGKPLTHWFRVGDVQDLLAQDERRLLDRLHKRSRKK